MKGKTKMAKKMMRGGTVAKKKMAGGGMAKMAKKKMRGGGVAAKKMMRGGMSKKKQYEKISNPIPRLGLAWIKQTLYQGW